MEQRPKIDGVIFKQSFTKDIEEKLLGKKEASQLQQKQLRVSFSDLNDQHRLIQLFAYIEQLMLVKLGIAHNDYPAVLKGISWPCFSQLKILELRFNAIYSIEALAFMNMENIEQVDVSDNRVNELKALNKTRWRKLHTINFKDCYVNVCNLERVKMSKNLQKIMHRSSLGFMRSQRVNLVKLEPSFICHQFHRMMDNTYLANKVPKSLVKKYLPIQ